MYHCMQVVQGQKGKKELLHDPRTHSGIARKKRQVEKRPFNWQGKKWPKRIQMRNRTPKRMPEKNVIDDQIFLTDWYISFPVKNNSKSPESIFFSISHLSSHQSPSPFFFYGSNCRIKDGSAATLGFPYAPDKKKNKKKKFELFVPPRGGEIPHFASNSSFEKKSVKIFFIILPEQNVPTTFTTKSMNLRCLYYNENTLLFVLEKRPFQG